MRRLAYIAFALAAFAVGVSADRAAYQAVDYFVPDPVIDVPADKRVKDYFGCEHLADFYFHVTLYAEVPCDLPGH